MKSKFSKAFFAIAGFLMLYGIVFLMWHHFIPKGFVDFNQEYQKAVFKTKVALAINKKVVSLKMDRIYAPYQGDSLVVFVKNKKRGYLNLRNAKVAIPPVFDHAWHFDGETGLAAAAAGSKLGFIDRHGRWAIPPSYPFNIDDLVTDEGFVFSNGTCIVPNNDKRGLIDPNDVLLLDVIYDDISERIHDQYRIVSSGDQYGLYSEKTRSFAISPGPDELYDSPNGIVIVETGPVLSQYLLDWSMNKKHMIFDTIEPIDSINTDPWDSGYDDESEPSTLSGFSKYSINSMYGIIDDLTGKVVCPPLFDNIEYFSKGIFKVTTGEFEYLINSRGEAINR